MLIQITCTLDGLVLRSKSSLFNDFIKKNRENLLHYHRFNEGGYEWSDRLLWCHCGDLFDVMADLTRYFENGNEFTPLNFCCVADLTRLPKAYSEYLD